MNDEVVIKVENVSKKYCKSLRQSMLYGIEDIGRNWLGFSSHSEKLRNNEFWALDDVSFELKKGEAIGLIGPNGSGKSTLLKMLNGIFWPDKGRIEVKGKVGPLIEVGAGFHPMLTGRENIYVNGAILGMTQKEVNAKFDDILEFADIGDFIDAPVKTYSSGMFVRLGMAVAVHCEPDILLLDEVLAVGDINFQSRCLRRISEMMKKCSVIIVSHNPVILRFHCQRVLFLANGKTQVLGPSSEVIDIYNDYMNKLRLNENNLTNQSRYDSKVQLKSIILLDKNLKEVSEVFAGETLIIDGSLMVIKPLRNAIIGFSFKQDEIERSFICFSSQVNSDKFYNLSEGEHKFQITIPKLNLKAGLYNIGLVVTEDNVLGEHTWNGDKYIIVKNPHPEFGLYDLNVKFTIDS